MKHFVFRIAAQALLVSGLLSLGPIQRARGEEAEGSVGSVGIASPNHVWTTDPVLQFDVSTKAPGMHVVSLEDRTLGFFVSGPK